MKKSWKVIGITAAAAFALGLALVVAAAASGGSFEGVRGRIGLTSGTEIFQGGEIKSLDIQMSVGKLTVTPGDELRVDTRDIAENGFVCEIIDGVLTIRDDLESSWHIDIMRGLRFGSFNYEPSIHVYLPEDFIAEKAEFSVAAGALRVENLTAKEAEFEVNAGEITVIGLAADTVELSCNTGAARLDGKVREGGSFTCNIGHVELELDGVLNDYDVSGSVGLGRLEVGGSEWNFSGGGRLGKAGGIPLELGVDVGEMTLRFNG